MPRFAVNLSMMSTEAPFIKRFAAARRIGFDAMGFLLPYDYSPLQVQKQLEQSHLTLALFNTTPGDINAGKWRLSILPEREHEARAGIGPTLEYALVLNCEQVHVMAGIVPAGGDAERCRAVFVDNLRCATSRFVPHGKQVLVEALSSGVKSHYLLSSQYQALAIVREVARDSVFIQLDTLHAQKVGGNLTHLIRDYAGKYTYMQIVGLPDRHEPGDGEINYPWLFRLFDEVGYQGQIGCGYKPRGLTEEGLGWLDAWR